MIKCESKNGHVNVEINGKMYILQADFVMMCKALIEAFAEKSEDAGKEFHDWLVADFPKELDMNAEDFAKAVMSDSGLSKAQLIDKLGGLLEEFIDDLLKG